MLHAFVFAKSCSLLVLHALFVDNSFLDQIIVLGDFY